MTDKEAERLASVETKLRSLEKSVMRVEEKQDHWREDVVTRDEVRELLRTRDQHLNVLREELREFKKSREDERDVQRQLMPQWIAVALSVGSLLLMMLFR